MSELIKAVKTGDIDKIKTLIESGVNLEIKDKYGNTALKVATGYNEKNIINILLEAGANVNTKNGTGFTPLMTAVVDNDVELVEILLKAGSDVNAKSIEGRSVLIEAVTNNPVSYEIVKILLDAGADVNYKLFREGGGILEHAIFYRNPVDMDIVNLLLEYGANPYINLYRYKHIQDKIKLVENIIWKSMYNNIKLQARQYSSSENISEGDPTLSYDVWELILLRQKQQWLCKTLSNRDDIYILLGFAEMLEIPIPENITKKALCHLISEQLAWGGKYSVNSSLYTSERSKQVKETIIRLAYKMGIDIHQPVDKILDELARFM